MSDFITRTTTRAQVELYSFSRALVAYASRAAQRVTREQTGQDMVEYGGVLLVVSVIVAAVVATPIGSDVAKGVSGLVQDILTGVNGKTGK